MDTMIFPPFFPFLSLTTYLWTFLSSFLLVVTHSISKAYFIQFRLKSATFWNKLLMISLVNMLYTSLNFFRVNLFYNNFKNGLSLIHNRRLTFSELLIVVWLFIGSIQIIVLLQLLMLRCLIKWSGSRFAYKLAGFFFNQQYGTYRL